MRTRSAILLGAAMLAAGVLTVGAIVAAAPQSSTAAGVAGAGGSATVASPRAAPIPTTPPTPTPTGTAAAALSAAQGAAGVLTQAGGTGAGLLFGAAVLDLVTGEFAVGPDGNQTFYSASEIKLVTAVDVLDRAATGEIVLTEDDQERLDRMLSMSDDDAMSAMWSRFDGAGGVTRVATRLGLTGTTSPEDPSQWGGARTTARDIAVVYQHVLTDLDPVGRDQILSALYASTPTSADGFDQAYGIWGNGDAAKQGWQCCYDDAKELHSSGLIDGRYVAVLLTNRPDTVSWPDSRAQLTTIAVALRAVLPA